MQAEKFKHVYPFFATPLRRYCLGIIVASIAASIIYWEQPHTYAAYFKLSDEHKSTDVIIGLTPDIAWMKQRLNKNDQSLNNIHVYVTVLKNEKFLKGLGNTYLPQYHTSYAEYLYQHHRLFGWRRIKTQSQVEEVIRNNISYQINDNRYTCVVRFIDQDPAVALQMSRQANQMLRQFLYQHYIKEQKKNIENERTALINSKDKYLKAQKAYVRFADANADATTQTINRRIEYLDQQRQLAYQKYNKDNLEYVRLKALMQRHILPYTMLREPYIDNSYSRPSFTWTELACLFIAFVVTTWWNLYLKKNLQVKEEE